MSARTDVDIRPLEEGDLEAVVSLLDRALGPAPGGAERGDLFSWKHFGNPFGRSIALVAEQGGRVVGLRAFMRWRLSVGTGSAEVHAVRAVDTATDPALQRRGLFSRLTGQALELCRKEGVRLVFNTPNTRSLPGYLKMGWSEVATWPVAVRARRPLRLGWAVVRRDLRSGPAAAPPPGSPLRPAAEILDAPHIESLVAAARPGAGLFTPRSRLYLRWRYTAGPLPYHALAEGDPPGALVVVRLRNRGRLREAVLCEAFCEPGQEATLARLLRHVPEAAGADHAVASISPAWVAGRRLGRAGYRKVPRAGMRFVVRPLDDSLPEVLDEGGWALTLGDLEVF